MFQKTSGIDEGKFYWIRRGKGREYHDFQSKNFCHTVMESFVREPFIALLNWGSKTYLGFEKAGALYSRFAVENVLSYCTETLRRGHLLCSAADFFWQREKYG